MSPDPVDLLEELVATPSQSGQEGAAVTLLVERMAELELEAHIDAAGNAVGVRSCPDANNHIDREIVLLGHIDTVPGVVRVRREEGCLYGRGAVDAKGPLATFVVAAARARLRPGTRLVVIGAVEEEAPSSKGAHYVVERYQPQACIIGEPSGWNAITLGYKGSLLLDCRFAQPAGHRAGPAPGAAERAVAWWHQLCARTDEHNRDHTALFEQILPALYHIASHSDGLCDSAEMRIGLRLPPGFDQDSFLAGLVIPPQQGKVRIHAHLPAFRGDRTSPLVQAFNRALRGHNQRPRHLLKTGTSDMNVVGPHWRCPIVAYGPGDSSLDHTPEEHIVIDDFCRAIGVLEAVLAQI